MKANDIARSPKNYGSSEPDRHTAYLRLAGERDSGLALNSFEKIIQKIFR